MAKTKISEFSATPANNTDIDSINIAEGCAPSGINDAIRELMAQLKDFQTGAVGDSFNGPVNGTVGATTPAAGAFTTLSASSTLGVTGVSTLTGGAVVQGLTVGRGLGAVATNTAVGASALAANTTGSQNVAIGANALVSNLDGNLNVAIGGREQSVSNWGPMQSNTSGFQNTAVGSGALATNSSASGNSAFGYMALFGNSTGASNVGLGYQALRSNTTASNNTAVGYQAGYSNTTGAQNTATGYQALFSNTTGTNNVAYGYASLTANTTADDNVAYGVSSMLGNTTGTGNSGLGRSALRTNTTGSYNTAVGMDALRLSTTASNNTAVGYQAGYNNTTGTLNTFIGPYQAGYFVTTGSKNTILGGYNGNQGSLDIRTASNYIVLSDGDGNPRGVFDSSGNLLVGSPTNGGQTGVGIFTQTGTADCLTANATNASFTSAILNIRTTRNTTNSTFKAIQYYNDGATALKFYVIDSGAIYSTSTSITSISDQRFKENIKDIDVGLDAVMALKPRRFDWIDGKGENRKNAVGFIAQEVQTVLPDLISTYEISPEDTTEYLAIRQSDLIPTLVKAIQELKVELDAYKSTHP